MGAGKTTLGKQLAKKLNAAFADTDRQNCINNQTNTVAELIAKKGIDFFRTQEQVALHQVAKENTVVATGGGTPCFFDNLEWMKKNGTVVYIALDEKTLFNRLKQTNLNERPLLAGKTDDELSLYIAQTLQERKAYYEQAHITFNPLNNKLDTLANLLIDSWPFNFPTRYSQILKL